MPASVYHVFSNLIADGTNSSIVRPSDWNSAHGVTLNLSGTDMIGGFSNAGNVSFGTNTAGYITATAVVTGAAGAGTGFTGTNATGTLDAGGLRLSVAAPGGGGGAAISAGTQSQNTGTVIFSNASGVSFGLNAGTLTASVQTNYLTTAQPVGAYLTTARASNDGVGLGTAITNGTWTVNSAGISLNLSNHLTTARASNDAIGTNTALTANGVSVTANSSGLSLNFPAFLTTAQSPGAYLTTARASNDAIGLNSALTANGVSVTANSSGLSLNFPAFMVTSERANFYDTAGHTFADQTHSHGNPTLFLTNITGTTASASNGLTLSLSAGAGGTINQTGPNIAAAGATITAGTVVFSNLNGVSFGLAGSTMTGSVALNATLTQRVQYPMGALSALSVIGNGSFSINRIDNLQDLSATRLDVPFLMTVTSSATAATWGFGLTAIAGIYTRNVSTLSILSSASTTWAFTNASNTAGSTQMLQAAVRPISVPMNVVMSPGEYYVGFGISTNTISSGTATTALGIALSAMGGLGYSAAVGHVGDFTMATNTSTGLYGGMGVYSAAFSSAPPSLSISGINQTGSYYSRANIGLIFRNI